MKIFNVTFFSNTTKNVKNPAVPPTWDELATSNQNINPEGIQYIVPNNFNEIYDLFLDYYGSTLTVWLEAVKKIKYGKETGIPDNCIAIEIFTYLLYLTDLSFSSWQKRLSLSQRILFRSYLQTRFINYIHTNGASNDQIEEIKNTFINRVAEYKSARSECTSEEQFIEIIRQLFFSNLTYAIENQACFWWKKEYMNYEVKKGTLKQKALHEFFWKTVNTTS